MKTRVIVFTLFLGLFWGFVVALVFGVSLTLAFGISLELTAMATTFAGLAAAASWLVTDGISGNRKTQWISATVVYALVLLVLTLMTPMGINMAEQPLGAVVLTWVLALTTVAALAVVFGRHSWRDLDKYTFEAAIIRACKTFGFVFFIVIVALPFYAMVLTSFKKQSELLANPLDYSIDFSQGLSALFSSYVELFVNFDFGHYILVSAVVSVSTVILTLLASIPGAYAIARLRFPGRLAFSRSILMIYMVPAIVLVIPLYAVFSQLGLRDSLLGLFIVYPATTIPVALYMLQGYFRSIPPELEEAGLMDGCSRLRVIRSITLPLSLPAIASVALYVFMIAWNEFLFAFMFIDSPEFFTLPRAVVSLNSSEIPRQHLFAGAVIVTIPVLVVFLWFERYLVSGLTAGSVKG